MDAYNSVFQCLNKACKQERHKTNLQRCGKFDLLRFCSDVARTKEAIIIKHMLRDRGKPTISIQKNKENISSISKYPFVFSIHAAEELVSSNLLTASSACWYLYEIFPGSVVSSRTQYLDLNWRYFEFAAENLITMCAISTMAAVKGGRRQMRD